MKRCPICQHTYMDETVKFCRHDGMSLIDDLSNEPTKLFLPPNNLNAEFLTQPIQNAPSIAVMPFVNVNNDPESEYFCDELAGEVIVKLAKLNNLKVAARTSSFSFKSKNIHITEIGQTLGVDTVLEGQVLKVGNRLRINVELVNVLRGTCLWSEQYDRQMKDIFDILDEITLAIHQRLRSKDSEPACTG